MLGTIGSMILGVGLGRRHGGHAAVSQPGAARRGLRLHLVLPGGASLCAAGDHGHRHWAILYPVLDIGVPFGQQIGPRPGLVDSI
jgi:hypothetical protein